MRKSKILVIIAVLTVLVMCMETAMVSAASLSEIRKNIQEKQSELAAGEEKEKSLASQVSELEQQIDKLEASITEGEAQLTTLEAELAEAEAKVDTQNENLNARLRNMYKSGTIGFVDVLLDSGSFSEFLTNLDMVEKIYSEDQEVLEELETAYNEIDAKKKEIETLQAELEKSKTVAEEQKTTVEKQKAEIAASNEETEKMIDEMNAEAARLTSYIQNNASSSSTSSYTGGQLAWPVPSSSRITSYYGYRIHPTLGYNKLHTGIDIGASQGQAVVSANSGTVITSKYNSSYGYYIIVDHGGGIATLYAHNSKLLVSVGQSVSRGQQIARIGSTGNSTGPHLHFEVRVNGSPVNPLPYLR
ncbi:MAG: peptidoglycan DD-metalloendopeptidase family protein [Bacillota bacterium]|nr:peptidoglycan DD-metalloendopeptidase family protein [Bacillota bacterium]